MIARRRKTLLKFCAAAALATLPFSAAFGAESDTTTPPVATETTTTCTDGHVWSDEKKECVTPESIATEPATDAVPAEDAVPAADPAAGEQKKSERTPDDILYEAAREFAYAGQHENALRALHAARNQDDPRILNYLGYNNRKLGRVDIGMAYYRKALSIDGNYILARSYMGQALFEQGDVQGARVQLVEIRDRGGENTWAYRALSDTIGGRATTY